MRKTSVLSLAFLGVVFAVAVALQFLHVPNVKDGREGGGTVSGRLAQKLPLRSGPWIGRDEPLGPSEAVSDAASRILNFDDYAYRIYQRDGLRLGVYIAYWEPGRMPTHKVASHTPDRCWVENGWRCDQARFQVPIAAATGHFKPAEWRVFTPPGGGQKQYVLYWHLVGDELYDYGERLNTRPHPVKWIRDSLAYALRGSREQYFIRLTSDRPLEEFVADPGLSEVWRALEGLGLSLRAPGPSGG